MYLDQHLASNAILQLLALWSITRSVCSSVGGLHTSVCKMFTCQMSSNPVSPSNRTRALWSISWKLFWLRKQFWTKNDCDSYTLQKRQGLWPAVLHCNFATLCRLCPPTGIDKDNDQQFYNVLIPTLRKMLVYRTNKPINQLLSTPEW